jgi:hypothetical protein
MGLDAVESRDVGVVDRRECPGFALESREAIGVGGKGLRQDLDRHIAGEFRIPGAIDLAHSAFAQCGEDFVSAEARAGDQAHEWRTRETIQRIAPTP